MLRLIWNTLVLVARLFLVGYLPPAARKAKVVGVKFMGRKFAVSIAPADDADALVASSRLQVRRVIEAGGPPTVFDYPLASPDDAVEAEINEDEAFAFRIVDTNHFGIDNDPLWQEGDAPDADPTPVRSAEILEYRLLPV